VFIYYKNFDLVIFGHATFLFLLISMREVIKDLTNLKGDLVQNYHTIPVVYGENAAKMMLTLLSILTLIPILLLILKFEIGYMKFYFYGSIFVLIVFVGVLWRSDRKLHYVFLHNIIKFIIVVGVFSIVLINIDLLLNRLF